MISVKLTFGACQNRIEFQVRDREDTIASTRAGCAPRSDIIIETHSLPRSFGAAPRAFTFYLAHPVRSIRVNSWLNRTNLTLTYEGQIKGTVGKRKILRIFLIGMLCGVMTAAAFTYAFALPANTYYWQSEIWKRGGAVWTMDMKTGQTGWRWLVEPKKDTPRQKPVAVPSYKVNVQSERL